jgi:hypothetical protein
MGFILEILFKCLGAIIARVLTGIAFDLFFDRLFDFIGQCWKRACSYIGVMLFASKKEKDEYWD